jgi:hypothetical protein
MGGGSAVAQPMGGVDGLFPSPASPDRRLLRRWSFHVLLIVIPTVVNYEQDGVQLRFCLVLNPYNMHLQCSWRLD